MRPISLRISTSCKPHRQPSCHHHWKRTCRACEGVPTKLHLPNEEEDLKNMDQQQYPCEQFLYKQLVLKLLAVPTPGRFSLLVPSYYNLPTTPQGTACLQSVTVSPGCSPAWGTALWFWWQFSMSVKGRCGTAQIWGSNSWSRDHSLPKGMIIHCSWIQVGGADTAPMCC